MSSDDIKTVGELRKELRWVQTWKDKCVVVQRNPELRALVMRSDIHPQKLSNASFATSPCCSASCTKRWINSSGYSAGARANWSRPQ